MRNSRNFDGLLWNRKIITDILLQGLSIKVFLLILE
jgi:hypothetical protein